MIEIKSGESIFIEFDDREGNGLSKDQSDSMIDEMREIAHKYGFDYCSSGDNKSMQRWFTGLVMTSLQTILIDRIDEE